jgi:polyisoprenyl-teichoic acid--peptidoglycan teichoic acid transferase
MIRQRFPRALRLATVGVVLALAALVVPDSAVKPPEAELVKLERARAIDVSPGVIWILAVGSDARPGENMVRTRGDALQLIGLNTKTGAATAFGIPRDSWVPIPGYGSSRVNAALVFGGPELLGRTVGNLFGIQPDYVFVTRFKFFQKMVQSIGGIEVNNPVRFSDGNIKPKGFKTGRIRLTGYDALAFGRIRKSLIRGDFDRSANQQRVLRGIHAKVRAKRDVPGFLDRGVLSVLSNLRTNLTPAELYRLAHAMTQIQPGKITTCVLQGGIGNVGGASVVLPNLAMARSLGDRARKDATLSGC